MAVLAGRLARCPYCKRTKPSSPDLAFFEYRGPGSDADLEHCAHCAYHRRAHDPEHMRDTVRGLTVIEDGRCPGPEFESRGPMEFDSFYDGCRGFD